jgi:hypothetical protein
MFCEDKILHNSNVQNRAQLENNSFTEWEQFKLYFEPPIVDETAKH